MQQPPGRNIVIAPALALAVLALLGRAAWAEEAPPGGPPAPSAASDAEAEADARAHFKRAEAHFDKQQWREALAEYGKSLARKKTRGAMASAAECLKALGQYDDALDQLDALRRAFPVLPAKMEAKVAPAIAELQGKVGTLVVAGDAPAGATLLVDGRARGKLPLTAPLRLSAGSHAVQVDKEGFDPITATVEVAPRRETVAKLQAKSRLGRLRVSEKHNWALEVEVDGAVVGHTPWEGPVAAGDHEVRLHGFVRLDALAECAAPETGATATRAPGPDVAEMGSSRATTTVRLYDVTSLALGADDLDASLRIEPTPAFATVTVDDKVVGRGTWEGRLPLGPHTVEVSAGGFLPVRREVRLERRKQPDLHVELARPPAGASRRAARIAGAGVGFGASAVGLAVFAVEGARALAAINAVKSRCYPSCPTSEQANVDAASTLGNTSTVGLVVAGAGAVTGTLVLLLVRPDDRRPDAARAPRAWSVAAGLGRLEIGGRF
jgi:hypothetical protein